MVIPDDIVLKAIETSETLISYAKTLLKSAPDGSHVQVSCLKGYYNCGSCEACCLGWCSVCGGAEDELTSDCPGYKIPIDMLPLINQCKIDYTLSLQWYSRHPDVKSNSPKFKVK